MSYEVTGSITPGDMELEKRTYLPGIVISGACGTCGNPVKWEGSHDYLSYPIMGSAAEGYFYCTYGDGTDDFCGANTEFKIRLDLVVTVA